MAGEIVDPVVPGGNEQNTIASQVSSALTTPLPLFIVAGVMDLTEFIEVPSYKVNLVDGYDEWTDNNKVTHRDITHKKAQGSFNLKFFDIEDFLRFIATMKTYKKQNGSYDCSVYCVNELSAINVEMFVDFDPPNIMPHLGVKDCETIDVTVTQRTNQYIPQS